MNIHLRSIPERFLNGKISDDKINALANIAVIGSDINIKINAKNPMDYIEKYRITEDKLRQQLISTSIIDTKDSGYESWLNERANKLAQAGNAFLKELSEGL